MTSWNFLWPLHWQIARLGALENPAQVASGAPIEIGQVGSIGDEPAGVGKGWRKRADRREPVLDSRIDDAPQVIEDQRRGQDYQRAGTLACRPGDRRRDLADISDGERLDREAGCPGRGLGRPRLQLVHSWIAEHCDLTQIRLGLFEELELLAAHLRNVEDKTGEMAARVR